MVAEGKSATTVRKSFFALHAMLQAAVADRRLAYNPAQDVPLPAEQHGEQRFLSPSEVATLADVIDPRYRALVLVAVYGGLRFGELAALRRGRADLLRGRVMVAETLVDVAGVLTFGPPKTRNSVRVVPLPRLVVAELDEHLSRYVDKDADALVFTSPQGRPLRRSLFRRRVWTAAASKAGLGGLRFHDLRHTFVAVSIAAGADPKKVSVRAGHSSVAFTLDRYGHLYEDAEDQVTARLDALLDAAPAAPTARVVGLRP
jgi:integrase